MPPISEGYRLTIEEILAVDIMFSGHYDKYTLKEIKDALIKMISKFDKEAVDDNK